VGVWGEAVSDCRVLSSVSATERLGGVGVWGEAVSAIDVERVWQCVDGGYMAPGWGINPEITLEHDLDILCLSAGLPLCRLGHAAT
jgi:hypothetical protein